MTENSIGTIIIGSAIKIHRELGPGLLESVYEKILVHELRKNGLTPENQVKIPIIFDGITYEEGFRADIIVNNKVIIELKSKQFLTMCDKKQIHTYLKLSGLKLGYLLNFASTLMKDGIIRTVNGL